MKAAAEIESKEWRIAVGSDETIARLEPALATPTGSVFVFAHGAGGHMDDRGMLPLAQQFRMRGMHVVRFNFLYRAKGTSAPDAMPKLKDCIAAVVARVREELQPATLIIGGRSMGGRAASMRAAEKFACDGVLLLAYPLHPAGKPEKLRDAHLAQIEVPVLCINGTRDALCTHTLMQSMVSKLRDTWTMHWLQGADHSFRVTKASGRSDSDVLNEISGATSIWEAALRKRSAQPDGS